jgi:hypothetical protein
MTIKSDKIESLEKQARKWDEGNKGNPKITDFLILTGKQQSDLKRHLDQNWDPKYRHEVPRFIPAKLKHGYDSRVVRNKFSTDQFIDWIKAAGSDKAIIGSTEKPKKVGLKSDYTNPKTGKTYPVILTIDASSAGNFLVTSVIPVGVWRPEDV